MAEQTPEPLEQALSLPIKFTRTIEHRHLRLDEELKLEPLGKIEMYYYRSRWKGCLWTHWGYWSQFPKNTSAVDAVAFLTKAGWDMEAITKAGT